MKRERKGNCMYIYKSKDLNSNLVSGGTKELKGEREEGKEKEEKSPWKTVFLSFTIFSFSSAL